MIERLAGQVALFAVMLAGVGIGTLRGDMILFDLAGPTVLAAGAVAVILLGVGFYLVQRCGEGGFGTALRRAVLARKVWPRQVVLGLAIVASNLATFAFAARATGTILPVSALLTSVPLILTAMLVPISIAGWGFREGAAAALLPLAGATPEAAVAASVTFGLIILVASLPGAFVLMRRSADGPGG